MSVVGWILIAFGLCRLAVSVANAVLKLNLPLLTPAQTDRKDVSVLIPARNEERNIGHLLSDLTADGGGIREILVYNDQSTDSTEEIVRHWAEKNPAIRMIDAEELPAGWMGKNHACHRLAMEARGRYLLFLDADVRIDCRAVARSVYFLEWEKLSFFSIFPRQMMSGRGTALAVPLMNWILLSLLPLILVRTRPEPSLSAANGQFMFFEAATYRRMEPHRLFKASAVEDMSIVREYKRRRLKVAVLLGRNDVRCTMYHNLDEAIYGFSKNFFAFFGGSEVVCYAFAALTTLAPLVVFACSGLVAGVVYLFIICGIRVFVSRASKQSVRFNVLHMVSQQFVLWKIIVNASRKKRKKQLWWKGRNISSGS